MPDTSLSGPDGEPSTVRQLKRLVLVLVLSNIALGIFGFYFLRALDQKYSSLIEQAVPTLNDMQTLTAVSMEAMRTTNPTLYDDSSPGRTEMVQRARLALERDRELRGRILKREWLSRDNEKRVAFQNAGEAFSRTAAEVIGLLESRQMPEASKQREQSLRPLFERYIAATTEASDVFQAQSLQTSGSLSLRTGSISNVMLGLASWPLMISGILLLVMAVFVVVVLFNAFRHREAM